MADAQRNKTQPDRGFAWTVARAKAAVLLAEDTLTDEQIAEEVGVHRVTLFRWKEHPEFRAQVGDHIGQVQRGMLRLAIAKKHERVKVLDQLHTKLLTVIDERGKELAGQSAGAETGLVVRQIKSVGTGPNTQIVEEFVVDTSTPREIRGLQEQAAKEMGQWVEKSEIEGLTTTVEIVGIADDAI